MTARRIKRLEADLRRVERGLDGYTRTFRKHDGTPYYVEEHKPATGEYREQLLAQKEHIENQLAYDRQQLAAATAKASSSSGASTTSTSATACGPGGTTGSPSRRTPPRSSSTSGITGSRR
ncbi:hypothetical protein GCM10020220_019300 [Nonomuraea rubra]|uniref:hypothetical protein n=1 Tax=Nonomuraea rubra TaxID=46180 RepID=UPI0031ED4628